MNRHRTTARGVSLLILAALLGAGVVATAGAGPKPGLVDGKPIVFPLIGNYPYTMNFGDPRAQGSHEGIDIEGVPWRTPVVAAEAGKVKWWTTSARAGCMLYLYGKSGTTYLYIHLNNDLTEASEDKGGCKLGVAFAVEDGAKVTAGEQIGYVGDSGDAEGNHHLHFEVHPGDGPAVNPYPYLNAGERLLFPGSDRIGLLARVARDAGRGRRRDARTRRDVGSLVARRPVDPGRRHAGGADGPVPDGGGRLGAGLRTRATQAPDAAVADGSGNGRDGLYETGHRHARGASRRRRRAPRAPRHPPRRHDGLARAPPTRLSPSVPTATTASSTAPEARAT